MPRVVLPLAVYLKTQLGQCTGIRCVDATALTVCHNARIRPHRVFRAGARRGKTSIGWCSGVKLHLVAGDRGEFLAFCLAPANVDDRRPVPRPVRRLFGRLCRDEGYISPPLAEHLFVAHGIQLITKLRKNIHNHLLAYSDQLLLRKCAIIESINDYLKHVCQIEHIRHRSPFNFLVHLLAGLIAYCHQPKRPPLHLTAELTALPAA
jgi:hypothetical protein